MATDPSEVSVTATVKWFDRKKGFGFATPEEGGEDIFVHQRNIIADGKSPVLDEGDVIYYNLGEHNGRPTAINVRLPVGHQPAFEKRRRRGRNAKKEADAEAAAEMKASEDKPGHGEQGGDAAESGNGAPGLGPDGKPWRKVSESHVIDGRIPTKTHQTPRAHRTPARGHDAMTRVRSQLGIAKIRPRHAVVTKKPRSNRPQPTAPVLEYEAR